MVQLLFFHKLKCQFMDVLRMVGRGKQTCLTYFLMIDSVVGTVGVVPSGLDLFLWRSLGCFAEVQLFPQQMLLVNDGMEKEIRQVIVLLESCRTQLFPPCFLTSTLGMIVHQFSIRYLQYSKGINH